ncbi:TSUP family transporter [Sporosalibacterium faouarense]|uniref:TSUP family transporter n=1 Tax=Sporosalibacterium faouarense TaxID=516123 RepID=UPI00141D4D9E|nr:TSUP family transporter [Sporosalibacterium faouarense]MTI49101.1 sulfite exporter TauE/SafE family protein [Bacillota bacterium]
MKLFIIGLFSGIISGMGIGGGAILIPALIFFTNISQHEAQGINLIVFIPIASVALITHFLNKNISLKVAVPVIITGIIGSIIGSTLALNITSSLLRKMFGGFLLAMGIYQFFSKVKNKETPK